MRAFVLLATLFIGLAASSQTELPKELVSDSETAIDIAKVILKPIYGKQFIQQRTFTASLRDGVWYVAEKPKAPPGKIANNGTIEMQIMATDGRVIHIFLNI
ncbi:MAG: YbbC/YhhH family protein [Acidobacteriales bacterium]|nr:YbbC/YhhH family protein [Terriglobales bacterium]